VIQPMAHGGPDSHLWVGELQYVLVLPHRHASIHPTPGRAINNNNNELGVWNTGNSRASKKRIFVIGGGRLWDNQPSAQDNPHTNTGFLLLGCYKNQK
jgi:hypothetical protein